MMTEAVVRDLLDRVNGSIAGLSKELADLRGTIDGALTRADVTRIVRGMLRAEENQDQTAIGTVHCIACGRQMRQVSGALSEESAVRMLGEPPLSLAKFPTPASPIGQVFGSPGSLDRIDSPRSAKPAKRPRIRRARVVRE
jgi:hypothetical protein